MIYITTFPIKWELLNDIYIKVIVPNFMKTEKLLQIETKTFEAYTEAFLFSPVWAQRHVQRSLSWGSKACFWHPSPGVKLQCKL